MKYVFFSGNRAEIDIIFNIIEGVVKDTSIFRDSLDSIVILIGGYHDQLEITDVYRERAEGIGIELVRINRSVLTFESPVQTAITDTVTDASEWMMKESSDCVVCIYADRAESFGAAIAAFTCRIPIIHIEGGEITCGGTFDDRFRHAISALSDFHLPVTDAAKNVLLKSGYSAATLSVFPLYYRAPAISDLKDWQRKLYTSVFTKTKIAIATFHPLSSNPEQSSKEVNEFFSAIRKLQDVLDLIIVTYPNNDQGSHQIIERIQKLAIEPKVLIVSSLGLDLYHLILNLNDSDGRRVIALGNSSSGLKEVGYWGCQAINVGCRQDGRYKGSHVTDVSASTDEIVDTVAALINESSGINPSSSRESEREAAKYAWTRAVKFCSERSL